MKHFSKYGFKAVAALLLAVIGMIAGMNAEAAVVTGGSIVTVLSYVNLAPAGSLGAYVGATPMSDPNSEVQVQVITSERDRAIYEHNKNRPEFANCPQTPSYLRLETVIQNSSSSIIFKCFEGDGATVYPTEKRLDRNDAFIVTEIGFFLLKQDVANKKTNGLLHTYPNKVDFAAATGFVPADLLSIYNGRLSVTISKVKKIPDLDMMRFLHIPETQQSSSSNFDQRSRKDGFYPLTPQLVLDGSGTNEFEVQFPSFADWKGASATAGTDHRAVLYFRGLLVTNGSRNT